MEYFEQIYSLPTYDLLDPLESMLKQGSITWSKDQQICLNTTAQDDDIHLGCGSLVYDWNNSETIIDEKTGKEEIKVPKYETPMSEHDFIKLCTVFENTVFQDVYDELANKFHVGRVRLMRSTPKTCLTWHVDSSMRLHYPVKTQEGCLMVINDQAKHLPSNTWWKTDTTQKHTALNGSKQDRIHLVAVCLN